MRRAEVVEGRQCPQCGRTESQIKREYPEETRKLAKKTFYSGVSGRGVGRILGINKANVYNWIKKRNKCGKGGEVHRLFRT